MGFESGKVACMGLSRYCKLPPRSLSSPFVSQWGWSWGGSPWHTICLGFCLFVFFVLLGEIFILCSVHLAVVAPHVSGNAVLKTVFRFLVSFTVLFLWYYSWWNLLFVSLAAGPLPLLSNWKQFLGAWADPCVKCYSNLHSSSAWRCEKESGQALHFASISLLQLLEQNACWGN